MRTTVVPAQITSVEDRIAGNFTFDQILLLIAALLIATFLYIGIGPRLHLNPLKLSLIGLQFGVLGGLAIRYHGKIFAQWLVIYLRFFSRPRQYIFTKKDLAGRNILAPQIKKAKSVQRPKVQVSQAISSLSLLEQLRVDKLIENPALSVSFELSKKGGIDVSFKPVKD